MGDVLIEGVSIVSSPKIARLSLGVCPQFSAIDSELTVREHLMIYGRLKGLHRGDELKENVEALMAATSLYVYADRLASQLSGGNQRKLSLAIAMMGEFLTSRHWEVADMDTSGNPSVILIDEFSTGVDAKTKRDMWSTLRNVSVDKAVVITTRAFLQCLSWFSSPNNYIDSMEEASALANKIGIISKELLGKPTVRCDIRILLFCSYRYG